AQIGPTPSTWATSSASNFVRSAGYLNATRSGKSLDRVFQFYARVPACRTSLQDQVSRILLIFARFYLKSCRTCLILGLSPGPGPSGRRGVACDVGPIDAALTQRYRKLSPCLTMNGFGPDSWRSSP